MYLKPIYYRSVYGEPCGQYDESDHEEDIDDYEPHLDVEDTDDDDEEQNKEEKQRRKEVRESKRRENAEWQKRMDRRYERLAEKARETREEIRNSKKTYAKYRYPELCVGDDDRLRKRCYVPALSEHFEIILRFSEEFDLLSADSVQIGLSNIATGKHLRLGDIIRRSMVENQQFRYQEGFQEPSRYGKRRFAMEAQPGTEGIASMVHGRVLTDCQRYFQPSFRPGHNSPRLPSSTRDRHGIRNARSRRLDEVCHLAPHRGMHLIY